MKIEYIVEIYTGIVNERLIRCKDCTYRQEDGYCPITDCYDFGDKDYCSKAERKEE